MKDNQPLQWEYRNNPQYKGMPFDWEPCKPGQIAQVIRRAAFDVRIARATPPPEKPGEAPYYTADGRPLQYHEVSGGAGGCGAPDASRDPLTREDLLKLTNGHEPHRVDGWTRGMLLEGRRPLLEGECAKSRDEFGYPQDDKDYGWTVITHKSAPVTRAAFHYYRTRRPAPAPVEEREVAYVPLKPGEEIEAGDGWFEYGKFLKYANKIGNKSLGTALTFRPINILSLRAEIERLKGEMGKLRAKTDSRGVLSVTEADETYRESCWRMMYTTTFQGLEEVRKQLQQSQEQVASIARERDKARAELAECQRQLNDVITIARELRSRAESAGARVKALESELAVALIDQELLKNHQAEIASFSQQTADAISETVCHMQEIKRLQSELTTLRNRNRWVTVSERMPTATDADSDGDVWTLDNDLILSIREWDDAWMSQQKFWMTPILPPLPTSQAESEGKILIEQACVVMHDAYEEAARCAGWKTQIASRKPWVDVPEENKATMRVAVKALLTWQAALSTKRKGGVV